MSIVKSLFIDNVWRVGKGQEIHSINPTNNTIIWRGNSADAFQVELAIAAARKGLDTWKNFTLAERLAYLEKFNSILSSKQQEFTEILAQETGKPLWEAKTELLSMLSKLEISKQAFAERCKETTQEVAGVNTVLRHKPHGVAVILGPFNFPGHLPNGHIIPALLAGNTIVFKPSELTSYFAIKMMECWQAVNLPPGVINLVIGGIEVGQKLINSPNIDALFFTGSYATGNKIAAVSLNFPQRIIALEMGGNNPLVVANPDNIDAAAYLTVQSAFSTAGQRCTCARRLIVIQNKRGEQFVQRLRELTGRLQVGPYTLQPEPFMGPLISAAAADKVLAAYTNLLANGAKVLVPMQKLAYGAAFLSPGIIDVTDLKLQDDTEIFGPLLLVHWVKDFTAAVHEANNTAYGLSAGLITPEVELYQQFLREVKAGIITWNRPTVGSSSSLPFGGLGKSGNFRPSAYYAADYCAYPVASMEAKTISLPTTLVPGINL